MTLTIASMPNVMTDPGSVRANQSNTLFNIEAEQNVAFPAEQTDICPGVHFSEGLSDSVGLRSESLTW
jgi:hypothetical protein